MKILLVLNGTLTNVLGTPKVHYELKEEYERNGHVVDVLDWSNIYPKGKSSYLKFFGKSDTYYIWKALKTIASKYDIIDANVACVTYPKSSFGFEGLLMARSHGIWPLYRQSEKLEGFLRGIAKERENIKLKTRLGDIYRFFLKKATAEEFFQSIKYADVLHCLNKDEYNYYLSYGIDKDKLILIPNGLATEAIRTLNWKKDYHNTNSIAFIGSWTIRKGIKDFEEIVSKIQAKVSIDHFYLLGGHVDEVKVRKDFSHQNQAILKIMPNFVLSDLPSILSTCKVGLFPSYVEGFPFAIIEQLACGIPVVAYRVPGTCDILDKLESGLLIDPGNIESFADKVVEILNMDEANYRLLSAKCIVESNKYYLTDICKRFLGEFQARIKKIQLLK